MALAAQKAAGGTVAALPRLVQRLIYPLPYAETIAAQAKQRERRSAAVRRADPPGEHVQPDRPLVGERARAGPGGPVDGPGDRQRARAPSFSSDDLFRPQVAIEFGVFYLGRQLAQYNGRVYPALAAYNAGGGNVNGWLADFGADDPDLFAEQIPFAETSHYLQVVYENYQHYRRLYR